MPISWVYMQLQRWAERNITQRLSDNPLFQKLVISTNSAVRSTIQNTASKLPEDKRYGTPPLDDIASLPK
jgi:hypothetical protein